MKVVFFDAAGTLLRVKGSVGQVYLDHARKYGVRVSEDALQQAFQRAFADAPPLAFLVSDPMEIKTCERLWWFDVVHNVFYRTGMFEDFDKYFDEVFSYFAGPQAWELYPETLQTLQALDERGLELGIVSNFDSRPYEILLGLGIDRFFESGTLYSSASAAWRSASSIGCRSSSALWQNTGCLQARRSISGTVCERMSRVRRLRASKPCFCTGKKNRCPGWRPSGT